MSRKFSGTGSRAPRPAIHPRLPRQHQKLIAKAGRVSERQVRNWLNGADAPHAGASGNRQRAEQVAVDWASEQIHAAGKPVPSHPAAVLYAYLTRYNEITGRMSATHNLRGQVLRVNENPASLRPELAIAADRKSPAWISRAAIGEADVESFS